MARQASGLGTLARVALGAGAAGFGWSAGRDFYRFLRKNLWPVLALAAGAGGSGFAAWDLTRGHRGGNGAWRVVRDVVVAAASFAVGTVILLAMAGGKAGASAAAPVGLVVVAQAAAAVVGACVGLFQRGRRVKAFALEDHNLAFMQAEGLRDVGGREDTFLDRDDNELKLDDLRRDAMVFRVQGRRGKRAYIDLDADGRMLSYRIQA